MSRVSPAPEAHLQAGSGRRGILDELPGLVWSARQDGSVELLSRRWGEYTGKADAELLGWAWTAADLIHPDDHASLVETWAALRASGKEGRMEARLRRADGVYRWFQIQAGPVLDDRGNVVGWWGLNSDIDDQKQAQAQAADEQRLLEMITRGEPTSAILEGVVRIVERGSSSLRATILLLDEDGLTLRHAAVLSLPRSYTDAIDGTPIGPNAFSCGTAVWRRELVVLADIEKDPLGAPFRANALAHGLRACWSTPMLSSDGRVLGAFGIYATKPRTPTKSDLELLERCSRVTSIAIERSQSEEALRRSEAYRAEAERLSRTGTFGCDLQRREFTMSDGICEIIGLPSLPRPAIAQIASRIHEGDRERVADAVRQALRDGTTFDYEHRLVMEDGSVKLVRVVGRSRVTAAGNHEIVGAATDITASRRAADELQRAQAALTHVSRVTTLGELAASIAHEVNQPLTAIIADANAALNWLAADPPDVRRARESLTAISGDGERAGQVLLRIRSLLSRSPPRHRPCCLNQVVRDVVPLGLSELARLGLAVQQALSPDLPQVSGDPVQLQQVVLNLMLNAAEASKDMPPERRRVVIRTFVERRASGPFVHVAVDDAGVGLDPAIDKARLFDAFYTTKENGLGMGLSISRSIIERHGGKLWARPGEVFGATFAFAIGAAP
jgi:PAS domain S-box-containing protein